MSTQTEQLQAVIEARDQSSDVIAARAIFQDWYNNTIHNKTELDALIAGGSFDLIPDELKTELLALRTILNSANTALATHEEILNYKAE